MSVVLAAFARVLQKNTVPANSNVDANELGACLRDVSALLRVAARIPCELDMGTVNGFAPRDEKARAKQQLRVKERRVRADVMDIMGTEAPTLEDVLKAVSEMEVEALRELAKALGVATKTRVKKKRRSIKEVFVKKKKMITSIKKNLRVG